MKRNIYWNIFLLVLLFHFVVLLLCVLSVFGLLELSSLGTSNYVLAYVSRIFLICTFLLSCFFLFKKRKYHKDMYRTVALSLLSFVPFLDTLGNFYGWYDIDNILKIFWYDDIIHFLNPIFVSLSLYIYISKIKKLERKMSLFLSVILSLTLSSLWEIYEYWSDTLINTDMVKGGLDDTMQDLTFGLLGVSVFALFMIICQKKKKGEYHPRKI